MKIGTTRVETFSDGVMAIIITIMILAFKLPDFTKESTNLSIRTHLVEMLPFIATYSFSFMMIGIFWINHHHMFHLLKNTDEALLVQNLVFLFCMSFIPLATAFVGANPLIAESVAFYGLIMFLATLTFSIMRSYSLKKKLLHIDQDKAITKKIYAVSLKSRTKSYVGAMAYLCSIPLAFVNVFYSFICIAIPPVIFFIPEGIDDEIIAEKISEKN